MAKAPFKLEKSIERENDYEIVSFEDFCEKPSIVKTDPLSLNDNINYRLCFETDNSANIYESAGEISRDGEELKETSLDGLKASKRRPSATFSPFGRHVGGNKSSLFSSVIPKAKDDDEDSTSREHRYQRFSAHRSFYQRLSTCSPGVWSTIMILSLVLGLSIAVYWGVSSAVGGAWGEDHYRRLWERAHPDEKMPIAIDGVLEKNIPEYRYHDHNNLSTKNKNTSIGSSKRKHDYKKNFTERPVLLTEVCPKIEKDMRFDCYPQKDASEDKCTKRGCCWEAATQNVTSEIGIPYCFYPTPYSTYRRINMSETKHGVSAYFEKTMDTGYPGQFNLAYLEIRYLSNEVLQIKITDAENKRFETPIPEVPTLIGALTNMSYRLTMDNQALGFKVVRNDDNVTIFDTQIGGLILSDKFLQISSMLSSDKVYGLGERQGPLKLDMNWNIHTIFNKDGVPIENMNLYGSQPFSLVLEDSGKSHGVLMLNSNAMDVILQPTPAITYRMIGGVVNLVVILGDSPGDVVSRYTEVVGRPFMPPYWSLGFHLCKFSYPTLNVTEQVWKNNREAGLPFDVQWNDLDYMDHAKDFTYDHLSYKRLPDFVKKLHSVGMHYVVLVDPGISASEKVGSYLPWDRGLELDVFVKNSTKQPFIGKVWNTKSTVWPDFTNPNATGYWLEMLKMFHDKVPFDGAWIDMNEPSNFLDGPLYGTCEPEDLPYTPYHTPSTGLATKTICMDALQYGGLHYDWHNLYALTEAISTNFALSEIRGARPFIITRSNFPGLGQFAGHWSGDVGSTWHDMRMSVPAILNYNMFGIPMVGADICGFEGNTTKELCKRWMQLGAFYPFSRNHNSDTSIPQDPYSLGPEVLSASRDALSVRYLLLPYYYTLFWRAHVYGDTVVRPMFFEWPLDPACTSEDSQFLVGPHVMVAPLLEPGITTRIAYLPGDQPWVSIVSERYFTGNATITDQDYVLIRPAAILVVQSPPSSIISTSLCRGRPLQLLVHAHPAYGARGHFYWDDGDSLHTYEEKKYSLLEFNLKNNTIKSKIVYWGFGVPSMNNITIYGVKSNIATVTIDNKPCKKDCSFIYDSSKYKLVIYNLNLSMDRPFSVSWIEEHLYKPHVSKGNDIKVKNNIKKL